MRLSTPSQHIYPLLFTSCGDIVQLEVMAITGVQMGRDKERTGDSSYSRPVLSLPTSQRGPSHPQAYSTPPCAVTPGPRTEPPTARRAQTRPDARPQPGSHLLPRAILPITALRALSIKTLAGRTGGRVSNVPLPHGMRYLIRLLCIVLVLLDSALACQ